MFAHPSLNEGQLSCNKERYCIPERPITFFRVNSRICLPIGDPSTHYINFLDVPIGNSRSDSRAGWATRENTRVPSAEILRADCMLLHVTACYCMLAKGSALPKCRHFFTPNLTFCLKNNFMILKCN